MAAVRLGRLWLGLGREAAVGRRACGAVGRRGTAARRAAEGGGGDALGPDPGPAGPIWVGTGVLALRGARSADGSRYSLCRVQRRQRPACCSVVAGFTSLRAQPDMIVIGVPQAGASRACWARPNLIGTGVPCHRVRSTTAKGGGGSSLPRGRGTANPESGYSSLSSCRPRDDTFGETTMEAS